MKKMWAGVLILALLLAAGITVTAVMQHVHSDLAEKLQEAAQLSQTDWKKATALAESAGAHWEKHRFWIAALVDHEPLEEISSLFSQLALCQSDGQQPEFASICLRLASICSMLEEGQCPYWWNLL